MKQGFIERLRVLVLSQPGRTEKYERARILLRHELAQRNLNMRVNQMLENREYANWPMAPLQDRHDYTTTPPTGKLAITKFFKSFLP